MRDERKKVSREIVEEALKADVLHVESANLQGGGRASCFIWSKISRKTLACRWKVNNTREKESAKLDILLLSSAG